MKIDDLARSFGMTVGELAKTLNYSRQALYQERIAKTRRSDTAVQTLEDLNDAMYEAETEFARIRFNRRGQAIEEFRDMISKGRASDV